jgi:hypothetical protein
VSAPRAEAAYAPGPGPALGRKWRESDGVTLS